MNKWTFIRVPAFRLILPHVSITYPSTRTVTFTIPDDILGKTRLCTPYPVLGGDRVQSAPYRVGPDEAAAWGKLAEYVRSL